MISIFFLDQPILRFLFQIFIVPYLLYILEKKRTQLIFFTRTKMNIFSFNILFQNNQFWFVFLFVGGQAYYIAAVHYHHNSTSPGNFLRISLKTFTTSLTNDQTSWSEAEEQTVYLKEEKRDEIQIVEFDGAMANNFYFTLNGVNPR